MNEAEVLETLSRAIDSFAGAWEEEPARSHRWTGEQVAEALRKAEVPIKERLRELLARDGASIEIPLSQMPKRMDTGFGVVEREERQRCFVHPNELNDERLGPEDWEVEVVRPGEPIE